MFRVIRATVFSRAATLCRRCIAIFRGRLWISVIRASLISVASRLLLLCRVVRRLFACLRRSGCRLNLLQSTRETVYGAKLVQGRNERAMHSPHTRVCDVGGVACFFLPFSVCACVRLACSAALACGAALACSPAYPAIVRGNESSPRMLIQSNSGGAFILCVIAGEASG